MQWKQKDAILSFVDEEKILTKLSKIYGIKEIFGFLNPSKEDLHSPYGLKNIELAADRIIEAVAKGEQIAIHADVDLDGCGATTVMYQYLLNVTKNVSYFHAQRSEGHSIDLSENDIPEGTQLLIIVDSSTNSADSCKRISETGIDIIVLDHHLQDVLNPHCILVNPQQEGCTYENKAISGATVVWKTCQVIDKKFGTKYAEEFYEVVAFAMYGDMMSMLEPENRYIVDRGLRNVRNIGIKSLLQQLNKDMDKLKTSDIGFSIAPCVNAACRMDRIEEVLELLNTNDVNTAINKAKDVIEMNEQRKVIQAGFSERFITLVDPSKPISIITDNTIGGGFRGLCAGDISNEFKICSMILSDGDDDTYRGSFRAFNEFDLKSILETFPETLMVAGHPSAGGFRIKRKDLKKVHSRLNKLLKLNFHDQFIEYIMEINLSDLTESIIKDVEKFYHLSGKGIETGKFKITNLTVIDKKVMGKDKNTIKLSVVPTSDTYFLDEEDIKKLQPVATLMKFRTNEDYFPDELIGKEIEVVGELNMNEWLNPRTKKVLKTAQVFIEDFRVV